MTSVEQSLTTAYSSEENGIVERANQEVLRHLNAILFDSRVHDKWSFEQLPIVQRIMNTVEKTSTGITTAQLILNNSIQLSKQILRSQRVLYPLDTTNPSQQIALSDRMDEWIAGQNVLLKVAREKQSKMVCEVSLTKNLRGKPISVGKMSGKILKKILRYYLCSLGIKARILCSRR